MSTTTPSPLPEQARVPEYFQNSTDATRGEPLAVRANKRKVELEAALTKLPADDLRARGDIELALGSLQQMMTGDVDHLSESTAASLNRWLEGSKHLGEVTPKVRSDAPPVAPASSDT